jgi:hypothetical protein
MMTLVNRRVSQDVLLLSTALFAMAWAIARASVQSITIDEADTYLSFAGRDLRWVFWPDTNNHVLNSLLIWMTTHLVGPSSISMRVPALLGAALYILTCFFLCRVVTSQFTLRLPLFICLTYNPFVFDYLVAARGYSLAVAFLVAALAIPLWQGVSLDKTCALASLALGLSFTANYSFAFVDLAAFLVVITWALRKRGTEPALRVVGLCVMPGLAAALLICGYPLSHWRQATPIYYGAHSLREMTRSVTQASVYRLDPRLEGTGLYVAMSFLKTRLLRAIGILCICLLVVTRLDGSWLGNPDARRMGRFAAALAGIATFALGIHWLAFEFAGLPLPLARTGVYLVPLFTLIAGVIAGGPARSVISRWLRRGTVAAFCCLACYFVLCLRLTYFQEWQWDADAKDVYAVLARYNHTYGITDVGTSWYYTSTLNYYRAESKKENFAEFFWTVPPTEGKSIYVLNGAADREFLDKEKLVVVYRGKSSDVVIAARGEIARVCWKE